MRLSCSSCFSRFRKIVSSLRHCRRPKKLGVMMATRKVDASSERSIRARHCSPHLMSLRSWKISKSSRPVWVCTSSLRFSQNSVTPPRAKSSRRMIPAALSRGFLLFAKSTTNSRETSIRTKSLRSITATHHEKTGAPRYLIRVTFYADTPDSHYVIGRPAPANQIWILIGQGDLDIAAASDRLFLFWLRSGFLCSSHVHGAEVAPWHCVFGALTRR
jgi:hypothetical protein